jgi:thiol:disulfide interchange protein
LLLTLAGVGCGRATPNAHYPADWNRQHLDWRPYGLGLRDAKQAGKPIMVVFYTDWCP